MRHLSLALLAACSTVPASLERAEPIHLEPVVDGEPAADLEPVADTERLEEEGCLPRELLDEARRGELGNLGRALLHRGESGAFDGYRISTIRHGSPLDRAGLHNGDIVHAVNGVSTTSVAEVVALTETLRDVDTLSVDLTRRGEAVELTVRVGGCDGAE